MRDPATYNLDFDMFSKEADSVGARIMSARTQIFALPEF